MGEVKLVDFGLAKAASQVEDTEPGVVKGKFSYLSPEAANGKEVDHRADIFAVGILLYELLTGKRLFYGENDYQTVELVRQTRIPSIPSLNPEVEPELEEVIRKALARDMGERYQTAADLQDALAHYLFSRGMKVTSRDIKQLVADSLREKARTIPPTSKKKAENLIDSLIREEILQFTSLDQLEDPINIGARPLSPDEMSGEHKTPSADTVDPREWGLVNSEVIPLAKLKGKDGSAAAPAGPARPGSTPLVPPLGAEAAAVTKPSEDSDVRPLESMLEGPTGTTNVHRTPRPAGFPMLLVLSLVGLALLGAAAVYLAVRTGVLSR
jgi:serine/threonine-protein kinase